MVGFDNISFSSSFEPPLATTEIPKYPVGGAAMEMPVNLISKKYAESFRWFDARLLIRDSTVKSSIFRIRENLPTPNFHEETP
jgi:DNA-binding LacI/PurR family transcriptional regulator